MGLYSIKRPKVFATRISQIINVSSTQVQGNMLASKKLVNEFFIRNEASISNSIRKSTDNIIRANRRRANTLTRSIRKDIKKLTLDTKKSPNRIKTLIKEKYRVDDNVVARNLDTEIHAQAETVKIELAKGNGATHKTWRSQGDAKVRHTTFHDHVIGQRIPIDSEFRYSGMKASVAGDERLPANERIRCRCYLVFD